MVFCYNNEVFDQHRIWEKKKKKLHSSKKQTAEKSLKTSPDQSYFLSALSGLFEISFSVLKTHNEALSVHLLLPSLYFL